MSIGDWIMRMDPMDPGNVQDGAALDNHLKTAILRASQSDFYTRKFRDDGFDPSTVTSIEDLSRIPFTTKDELRGAYPMGMMATDRSEVVRIHSTSGTTGTPVIIPYTQEDVDIWKTMMVRCYRLAGLGAEDVIQVTPAYGLWTAGIGFQLGSEALGSMTVPMGPGNTDKQLRMMMDLGTTCLVSTSSYALLLAEEVRERDLSGLALRKGVIGSEHWGDSMRGRIEEELGIETHDIYGLTEIFGPGIAIDCGEHEGLHYWSDHLLFEIVDPLTGERLPDGEVGELVITTLTKRGAPLIRYRTRDITRIIPGACPCGCPFPRIGRILGRADDRIKVKGVNIYPGQVMDVIKDMPGVSSEYRIHLTRDRGRDAMELKVEVMDGMDKGSIAEGIAHIFRDRVGLAIGVTCLDLGSLPRSERKTARVVDDRGSDL